MAKGSKDPPFLIDRVNGRGRIPPSNFATMGVRLEIVMLKGAPPLCSVATYAEATVYLTASALRELAARAVLAAKLLEKRARVKGSEA